MTKGNDSPFYYLDIDDFHRIVDTLRSFRNDFSEDIPEFTSRYPDRLESIIATVQASFFGEDAYPTLCEKAAMLFYLTIKSHPLMNGNKRVATVALYEFLINNANEVLEVPEDVMFEMAVKTSESTNEEMESIKEYLMRNIGLMFYLEP